MPKFPVLFSAHGNPMNAVRDSPFSRFLSGWAADLPRPRAILAISAHWESSPIKVNAAAQPGTLYDFYGFPAELYKVRYPAPGHPELAAEVLEALQASNGEALPETKRGLDHGVWSPLLRLYPGADLPVVQVSLPPALELERAWALGEVLAFFRDRDCLIFASGNLVHNLGTADFHRALAPTETWAVEFDAWVKEALLRGDREALTTLAGAGASARQAHPSLEHYSPLLVAAGAAGSGASIQFPFEGFEHGTISMRCVRFQ